MAMVRLTFFVPSDVLERYDALVYRSGVNRSHLLREALEQGLAGVRAALPGLRARYGEGRTVRRRVVDLVKPRFSGQAASVGFNDVLASESFQSAASSCFRRLRLRSCWLSSASLLR